MLYLLLKCHFVNPYFLVVIARDILGVTFPMFVNLFLSQTLRYLSELHVADCRLVKQNALDSLP